YRQQHPIAPFRYQRLSSEWEPAGDGIPSTASLQDQLPIGTEIDDRNWDIIESNTYWGEWYTNFVLRSSFQIPVGWRVDERGEAGGVGLATSLYLPLGSAGDFVHPEVLVYVDGEAYAASDRYHHEIRLKPEWHDGKTHTLALHGWTGI